ncbi:hypothetical protein BN1050_00493 [Metalysinibacillus saudimassiliensis]|uniref:Uncharacterized protein n=1 Tax=Metalysinibacillus saudimassiliensis TaxID=1461583 RepID=A0A078M683_9BACL|nr:hypothetical protein BN1050_00493 [Metalysinibacillus saudimassiliensis]
MTLYQQTTALLEVCEGCLTRFFAMREQAAVPDFFTDVKPFADNWQPQVNDWAQAATAWLADHPQKYMHAVQIESAKEGLNQVIVQSFYKETSKKRFTDTVFAARYTLNSLQKLLEVQ